MARIIQVFLLFFTGLLLINNANASHHTDIYVSMNNIPPPPAREIIIEPRGGYGRGQCYIVPAGFIHGHWVNAHKVCRYPHQEWVAPHWECLRFNRSEGICMRWNWVPGYWVRQY